MTAPLLTIARMEFLATERVLWIRLLTGAYTLMTVAMAYASGVIGETHPDEAFARLTVAVLPLALTLVPLASLLVGVTAAATDDATSFLLAQPISRAQHLGGRWVGQAAALSLSLFAGLGTGAAMVALATGSRDAGRFGVLIAACVVAALAFLSIATLIVASVPRRSSAMGVAAFVWFSAVVLYDAVMLSVAVFASGLMGAKVLFVSVFANVVDLVRVLALLLAGTPHVLGAAGESWLRALGTPTAASALSVFVLLAWILVPLTIAVRIHTSRDV
jgi:ABC-type transport system involved in multi-copper enzyme maturation permease subunit